MTAKDIILWVESQSVDSGEPESLINSISAGNAGIRMIRRTEAFDFLADENFKVIVR